MSFITKRERVFNDYDLFDLPGRNEGKLKAYGSCTDSRAWSHFHSDKAEHLQDIIKRNHEKCSPKYVPTNVIVDTLMVAKNAEISRLKRRIAQFELLLAAYDQLDLDDNQRSEIAKAHEAIRAANKDLEELHFELDLSGFTEGVDSEAFETGKSRGDDSDRLSRGDDASWTFEKEFERKTEARAVQSEKPSESDKTTHAVDPRIKEMEEAIICKDAKLSAMQNTIAVMENDICEPYCVYAHIFTALEIIFGVLCQNEKYKEYLDLLVSGKDTRSIDIKGKIMFKLKVLEKFSKALIAPCAQQCGKAGECTCSYAKVLTKIDTAQLPRTLELKEADNKRAQLVADIIENDEMKQILSNKTSEESLNKAFDDCSDMYYTNIDTENLKRLKALQTSYDELVTIYEDLKHEKNCLQIKCAKYNDMETELEGLRLQLQEYNMLWNEKEHYRKRSMETDDLKQKYLVLYEETSNLETQLKAENEINNMRLRSINELRDDNLELERRLTQTSLAFEKERNLLQCKLKEADCKCMCYEEQVKSMSSQVDSLLGQDHEKPAENSPDSIILLNEIEALKEQTTHLKDLLSCSEDEKQTLQEQFQDKLNLINDLKMEIEDWKSSYEKTANRNDYLEKYADKMTKEIDTRLQENKTLSQDLEEKAVAVENLLSIINNKSLEINRLLTEIELHKSKHNDLEKLLNDADSHHSSCVEVLENEKKEREKSLELARQESLELLNKIKAYDELYHKHNDMAKSLQNQTKEKEDLINLLSDTLETNKRLQEELAAREDKNAFLSKEIQRLREINDNALSNINSLQSEKYEYKNSLDIARKESENLEMKLAQFEDLSNKLLNLKRSHESLEKQLEEQTADFDNAIHSINISRKVSEELLENAKRGENLKDELRKISKAHEQLLKENKALQDDLLNKNNDLEVVLQLLDKIKQENCNLTNDLEQVPLLEQTLKELQIKYNDVVLENEELHEDVITKTKEIDNIYIELKKKVAENLSLIDQAKDLKQYENKIKNNLKSLEEETGNTHAALETARKQSAQLIAKLNEYESLEQAFDELKEENERLRRELELKELAKKRTEKENNELEQQSNDLLSYNESLENSLINTRNQLISSVHSIDSYGDLIKEIQEMKKEKVLGMNKIRELMDKIDDFELLTTSLTEDVSARDDKIAVLENHINELEDEVRQLHINLDEALDASEELKNSSKHDIEDSIKKIEAHHSKATHNIKMELAKLENNKPLTSSRRESIKDKDKYLSEIAQLQNERGIIAVELKQLEIKSVGDSAIPPDNCDLQDILKSMDNIRRSMDEKSNISSTLQQTMLKVQTSSQLLLSKADEAKRLAEKGKQKILNEKEDAIRERLKLEKQLTDLKETLGNEISKDQKLIKDLEAELLNHKLIIDKINESSQNYITKLEDEMESLNNMYKKSLEKVDGQEKAIQDMTDQKHKYLDTIQKLNALLEEKSNDIMILQKSLSETKLKPCQSIGIQAYRETSLKNIWTQTENEVSKESTTRSGKDDIDEKMKSKNPNELLYADVLNSSKLGRDRRRTNRASSPNNQLENTDNHNEVQILTANVEPAFDFDKSSYLKYKVNQLSPGPTEQVSISSDEEISERIAETKISKENPKYSNRNKSDTGKTSNLKQSAKNIVPKVHIPKLGTSQSEITSPSKSTESMLGDKDIFFLYKDSDEKIKSKTKEPGNNKKRQEDTKPWEGKTITEENFKKKKIKPTLEIDLEHAGRIRTTSLSRTSESDQKSLKHQSKSTPSLHSQTNNQNQYVESTSQHAKTLVKEIGWNKKEEPDKLPDIESKLIEAKTTSHETRTKSPETRTKSPETRKKPPESRTNFPETRTKSSESKTKSPEQRNMSPETKRKSPETRKLTPETRTKSPETRTKSLETRIKSHEIRNKLPEVGSKSSEVRKKSSDTRIKSPEVRTKSPKARTKSLEARSSDKSKPEVKRTDRKFTSPENPIEELLITPHDNSIEKAKKAQTRANIERNSFEQPKNKTNDSHKKEEPNEDHNVVNNLRDSIIGYNDQNIYNFTANENLHDNSIEKPRKAQTRPNIQRNSFDKPKNKANERRTKEESDEDHNVVNNLPDSYIGYNEQNVNKFVPNENLRHESLQIGKESFFKDQEKNTDLRADKIDKTSRRSVSNESFPAIYTRQSDYLHAPLSTTSHSNKMGSYSDSSSKKALNLSMVDKGVLVKLDAPEDFEDKIRRLSNALEDAEKESKNKIEAIKQQYDANIRDIINEHNQGVRNMQGLHEETLHDVLSIHENEVENLRSMSIEAMRKLDKMEKENKTFKKKVQESNIPGSQEQESVKLIAKSKTRKSLTQTNVEAFNVKPKVRHLGPCTCSFDVNISDTIRTIFEQVDADQRKLAEQKYLKYVANKLTYGDLETLDAEELSFLHFKVCRTWKVKLSKEEVLKKKIDSLETELINKQRYAQEHIAALDEAVAEERRQLQEVREAICRSIMPMCVRDVTAPVASAAPERDISCQCNTNLNPCGDQERLSAGDLIPNYSNAEQRPKRKRLENNKGLVARVVVDDRRERRLYHDEPPTRLRRPPDRMPPRAHKK